MIDDCKLYLGDCLEILPTLEAGSVDAVITDPPYGIDYQSARRIDRGDWFSKLEGDLFINSEWVYKLKRITKHLSCLFVFCRWDVQEEWRKVIADEWLLKSQVIWDRCNHGLGDLKAQYAPCHDNAWFAIKNGYEFPGKRPISIYRVRRVPACNLKHPTQKPLALMKRIITDLTQPNATVLDPFMGSGTTGVACVQTGRRFIGIEISEEYFEIATKRIKEAQLQMRLPI